MSAELEATERALDRADQRIEVLERALFNAGKLTGTIVLQRDELLKAAQLSASTGWHLADALIAGRITNDEAVAIVQGIVGNLRTVANRIEAEADGR